MIVDYQAAWLQAMDKRILLWQLPVEVRILILIPPSIKPDTSHLAVVGKKFCKLVVHKLIVALPVTLRVRAPCLPLETCETMNGMWGYKITDQDYKSTKTLVHYLVNAAGKNANLLMNIGPQPDGELPAVALERLAEMGEWMKTYGETIYGTRGGIVAPHNCQSKLGF